MPLTRGHGYAKLCTSERCTNRVVAMGVPTTSTRKKVKVSSRAHKAAVGRYLTQASRESLAAEGIVHSDRQWKRIVAAARKGQPLRSATAATPTMTDRKQVAQSLTQAYSRVNARSSKRSRK